MQNFALALFDAPHDGQCSASGAAHPSQNFAPAGFSEPHFEQRIQSPEGKRLVLLVSPGAGKGQRACRLQLDRSDPTDMDRCSELYHKFAGRWDIRISSDLPSV